MSRDQQTATYKTAKGQNAGYYDNAQNSYTQAQQDVGNYEDQLSKYASSNPYVAGGQYQVEGNKAVANTADAAARAAGEALQGQALRTGNNSAGSIAATEKMQQENTRDLSAEEAKMNQDRIGKGADYGHSVLAASSLPAEMETTLSGQQGQLAAGALGTQENAAKQPSWMDEFGSAFGQSLGSGLGKVASTGVGA